MARALFVLLGVLPCAGLVGWAAVRHSAGYRDAIERRFERVIGLPLDIGSVEHLRPDGLRLRDCRLSSSAGGVLLSVPEIEVESSPRELRLTLERLDCTPELARTLADLAREWLRQAVRFPVDCVIDVEDFSWRPRAQAPAHGGAGRLRIECVAANGSRAVRVSRGGIGGGTPDEVRVVAGGAEATGAAGMEVHAGVAEPVPIAVLEALAGLDSETLPWGEAAAVSGDISAVIDGGVSSGSAHIRGEQIDLAAVSRHLPHRLSGEAVLAIERLAWDRGRVVACECRWAVSRGRVGQRLLDACVSVLGCRPGPAFRSLARDEVRSFDDLSGRLRIENGTIDLRAEAGRDGCLAKVQGLSMLDEPQAAVPLDRMAWLLAPPGSAAVPAARITAWLIDCFAIDSPGQAVILAAGTAAEPGGASSHAMRSSGTAACGS
ncbi:MAG: hypothetical protein ACKOK8_03330, partial [Planctomycetia bacterium]